MESYLAQVLSFGGNFAPMGWATCSGQLLPVSQYTALFSLLGTQYGGDGKTNFALPDLRGRRIIGQGQGPGLEPYDVGNANGAENSTLITYNMPPHTHIIALQCDAENAGESSPQNNYLGTGSVPIYSASYSGHMATQPLACSVAGGSQPFSILTPSLVMTQIISIEGYYPTRD